MMRFLFLFSLGLLAGCGAHLQEFKQLEPQTYPTVVKGSTAALIQEQNLGKHSYSPPAPPPPPAMAPPPPPPPPQLVMPPAPPPPAISSSEVAIPAATSTVKARLSARAPASAVPQVDTISDQMIRANMVFSIDEQRNISELVEAQLVIGLAANGEITVVGSGQVIQTQISVGRIIIATLTANDFDVKLVGTERQPLVADRNLQWQWQLKPKSAGTFPITLVVISEFDVAGGREKITLESYRKTVEITITHYQIAKLWFVENWKWLSTTVVIPVIVWLWNRRSKKRSANKTDP